MGITVLVRGGVQMERQAIAKVQKMPTGNDHADGPAQQRHRPSARSAGEEQVRRGRAGVGRATPREPADHRKLEGTFGRAKGRAEAATGWAAHNVEHQSGRSGHFDQAAPYGDVGLGQEQDRVPHRTGEGDGRDPQEANSGRRREDERRPEQGAPRSGKERGRPVLGGILPRPLRGEPGRRRIGDAPPAEAEPPPRGTDQGHVDIRGRGQEGQDEEEVEHTKDIESRVDRCNGRS